MQLYCIEEQWFISYCSHGKLDLNIKINKFKANKNMKQLQDNSGDLRTYSDRLLVMF